MEIYMPKPKTIVLRAAGSNCDYETAYAFKRVGSDVDLVHVNRLFSGDISLDAFQILAIPGGFTYGDDIAAGKILANEFKYKLSSHLSKFHSDGNLIIGICNGFQVLVKAGLLSKVDLSSEQNITLTNNDSGKFEDRWVYLSVETSICVFTKDMPNMVYFPVAHAEGKFVAQNDNVHTQLENNRQVVFRYCNPNGGCAVYPWNPNGSESAIAGVCDSTGRVLGMMPHPERHFDPTHHPRWTRQGLQKEGDGVAVFRNAVNYVR
jgi:phosphoribosylformylglycinamidine synthase I